MNDFDDILEQPAEQESPAQEKPPGSNSPVITAS
mgnify:CR=1 FL=1